MHFFDYLRLSITEQELVAPMRLARFISEAYEEEDHRDELQRCDESQQELLETVLKEGAWRQRSSMAMGSLGTDTEEMHTALMEASGHERDEPSPRYFFIGFVEETIYACATLGGVLWFCLELPANYESTRLLVTCMSTVLLNAVYSKRMQLAVLAEPRILPEEARVIGASAAAASTAGGVVEKTSRKRPVAKLSENRGVGGGGGSSSSKSLALSETTTDKEKQ